MENNILIVDDSRLVREAISKMLLSCGVKKSAISSIEQGVDAIDYFDFFNANLVICGDNLADMSAQKLILQVNDKVKQSGVKVQYLLLQQADRLINEITFLSPEQYLVLQKPFDKKTFLNALYNLTKQSIYTPKKIDPVNNNKVVNLPLSTKKSTILIVDDEPINIDVAAALLKSTYRVLVATSGSQALTIIQNNYQSIDLILLDIMMPKMDGYEVCRRLKLDNKTATIPIFFLTAKSEIEDVTKGFAVGAVDYITKPIQSEILLARVATHVNLQKSQKLLYKQINTLKESVKLREDIEKVTQHDLKGPLSSILFEVENLADKNKSLAIKDAVNKVISMINRSLDIFKIEQGTYKLKAEHTDLSPIVTDAVNACSISAKDKDVSLQTEGFQRSNLAMVEPLLCLSIFNNLIKNAVEASKSNSVIEIKLYQQNSTIVFSVLNDGAIPKTLRDTLFEKFTTSSTSQGSGIGTYSAKLLTEIQNGKITFEILDEKSTLFTVELPAANLS